MNIKNVISFYKDPISFLTKMSSNDVNSFKMAHLPFHHVCSDEAVKEVMLYQFDKFVKTPDAQKYTLKAIGKGLISTDKEDWKQSRKEANPLFTGKSLGLILPKVKESVRTVVQSLPSDDSLQSTFVSLTFNVISDLVLGVEDLSKSEQIAKVMDDLIEATYKKVIASIKLPLFIPIKTNRKINHSKSQYDLLVKQLVESSNSRSNDKTSLLDVYREKNPNLKQEVEVDFLKNVLAAGHETVSSGLTWVVYELSNHKGIEQNVIDEIKEVRLDDVINVDELYEAMPLTLAVILETLRLYPPIWLMGRYAVKNTQIQNVNIRKKHNVLISPFVIHRSTKYWNKPNEFNPVRFTNIKRNEQIKGYFPFGYGPRRCIGEQLSIVEMLLILVELYQNYKVTVEKHSPVSYNPFITLRASGDLQLKLSKL